MMKELSFTDTIARQIVGMNGFELFTLSTGEIADENGENISDFEHMLSTNNEIAICQIKLSFF